MSEGLEIRTATPDDCEFLWTLSMDPSVRSMSVRQEYFDLDAHTEWFTRRLNEPTTLFYVAVAKGVSVGSVRYGMSGDDAEIAIAVVPNERQHGYAGRMLEVTEPLAAVTFVPERFVALILPHNVLSIALFLGAGYRYVREEQRAGRQVRRYEKAVTAKR